MKKERLKKTANDGKINVHDDELMVSLGMRYPDLKPKDPSVWTKTPEEVRMLKVLRRRHKGKMHFHTIPIKHIPVRARLIVQLKKNKIFPKSTYSSECYMHEIGDILSKYYQDKNCLIVKYSYNGRTYEHWERPFWP